VFDARHSALLCDIQLKLALATQQIISFADEENSVFQISDQKNRPDVNTRKTKKLTETHIAQSEITYASQTNQLHCRLNFPPDGLFFLHTHKSISLSDFERVGSTISIGAPRERASDAICHWLTEQLQNFSYGSVLLKQRDLRIPLNLDHQ
jgi:hypothetical protein